FAGMSADYVRLIEKRLGVTMTPVPGLSWNEVLDGAKARQIDVIAGIKSTEERERVLNFTSDYLNFPLAIMARGTQAMIASLAGLRDEKLAVPTNYAAAEEIRARYPQLHQIPVPTLLDALRAVERGDADATVLNFGSAAYLIAKHGIKGVVVAAPAGFS